MPQRGVCDRQRLVERKRLRAVENGSVGAGDALAADVLGRQQTPAQPHACAPIRGDLAVARDGDDRQLRLDLELPSVPLGRALVGQHPRDRGRCAHRTVGLRERVAARAGADDVTPSYGAADLPARGERHQIAGVGDPAEALEELGDVHIGSVPQPTPRRISLSTGQPDVNNPSQGSHEGDTAGFFTSPWSLGRAGGMSVPGRRLGRT